MMLEIAISEYLTVLSSAVQQVLYAEIHIQPIIETIVVALNIDAYIIGFLNEIELLVMSHIAYVCHRRELLRKAETIEAGEDYAEVVDTLSAILVPTLTQLHIVSAVPNAPRERNTHVQHQSLRPAVVLRAERCGRGKCLVAKLHAVYQPPVLPDGESVCFPPLRNII